MDDRQELLSLLAEVLEYPGPELPFRVKRCREMLESLRPDAEGLLADFADFAAFAEREPAARLEELYTATFDLNPQCYPYAGYQLFGDDPKRSELMVGLRQAYQAAGFDTGNELPDHVPALLRFIASGRDEESEEELLGLVLGPALAKMAKTLEEKHNPYAKALAAAHLVMSNG